MALDVVKCDECGHVLPRSITEEFGWLLLDGEMDVWLCPKCQEAGSPRGWPKREEADE